jgi:hypothetical protein
MEAMQCLRDISSDARARAALLKLDQSWTQNNPSVEDVAEDGDQFGSCLT